MADVPYLYGIAITLMAAMASIAIWSPRRIVVRIGAIVVAGLMMPTAYASLSTLLSQPKPVSLEWVRRNAPEATVLGSSIVEGEAIYLWLQFPDGHEPRAYTLPYTLQTAKQLMEANRAAEEGKAELRMRKPFQRSLDTEEAQFYAEPQPAPPAKQRPTNQPQVYQHPSNTQ